MTTIDIAYALWGFVALAITWLVLGWMVPAVARQVTLFALHDHRDALYEAAVGMPELRDTLLYREIEFMLCWLLHAVERAPGDTLLLGALRMRQHVNNAKRGKASPDIASWRLRRLEHEFSTTFADPEGQEVVDQLVMIVDRIPRLLNFVAVMGNPLTLLLGVLAVPWIVVARLFSRTPRRRPEVISVTRGGLVEALPMVRIPEPLTPRAAA